MNDPQVLLSCSHVFHKACLDSFERFLRAEQRTCPLCRKAHYEKKRTRKGTQVARVRAATLMQSLWRGQCARREVQALKREWYARGEGDPKLRKVFFADRLADVSSRVEKSVQHREDALTRLFAELDRDVERSRNILAAHSRKMVEKAGPDAQGLMPGPGPDLALDEWDLVQQKAEARGDSDCPICIAAFSDDGSRQRVLLSCSHLFHLKCIQAFEGFSVFEKPQCPVCRAEYRKRVL